MFLHVIGFTLCLELLKFDVLADAMLEEVEPKEYKNGIKRFDMMIFFAILERHRLGAITLLDSAEIRSPTDQSNKQKATLLFSQIVNEFERLIDVTPTNIQHEQTKLWPFKCLFNFYVYV